MELDSSTIRNLVVTFFFAVYWGAMISSMPKFDVFDVWTFSREGQRWRAVARLMFGIALLNIYPIALFAFIYREPWFPIIFPSMPKAMLSAGIASLSVFSAVFLLPGLMQAGLGRFFYPKPQTGNSMSWPEEALKENIQPSDSAGVMLTVAALYVVVPFFAAWLIAC